MRIRQSNTGPEFVGDAIGDVPLWDGSEWLPGTLPLPNAFRVVNSLADLPDPVPTGNAAPRATGVINLEAGAPYLWASTIDGRVSDSVRLVVRQPLGAVVMRVDDNIQWTTDVDDDAGWTNENTINVYSFALANVGTGRALRCAAPNTAYYANWLTNKVRIDQSLVSWLGGIFGDMEVPNGVGLLRIAQSFGVVRCVKAAPPAAPIGAILMNQVYATGGSGAAALVDVGPNLYFSRVELVQCGSDDLKLLRLGADIAAPGTNGYVSAIGCQSGVAGGIEVPIGPVMPLGGLLVSGGQYNAVPFANFTPATPLAMCRNYRAGNAWGAETALVP